MPEVIETIVYQFEELSDGAKENARVSTSADRASDDAAGLPKMQRLVIHKQRLPILAARTDEISIQAPRGARILMLLEANEDEVFVGPGVGEISTGGEE